MFEKVLIADRGEVAARIARTCERMGIATVGIHSELEARAVHVDICDEAVCVPPTDPTADIDDAYGNTAAIVAAAAQIGAQAIHPGHGRLSESPAFARAAADAGLTFVGPPAETLARYSDKIHSRELARLAGVRAIPGSEGAVADLAAARVVAEDIGYPLLVKAAAGGGGVALQLVEDEAELEDAMQSCRERARERFEDDRIYLEAYIARARHLEVQLLRDAAGECAALGERECSIQRRHQKVIEESPSPGLSGLQHGELKRRILLDASARIAKEGGYVNAGTAEFLMDADGGLYFLEWSPHLQVGHAVTEMCTGLDLVEQQLRIAAGEGLPSAITRAPASGHAIEARVHAEDVGRGFAPAEGEIKALRWPTVAPGALRVETGIAAGSIIRPQYDTLIAKMITYSQTRHQALLTLDRVLAETVVEPLDTNLAFLRKVLGDESFRAGQYDTEFVQRLLEV